MAFSAFFSRNQDDRNVGDIWGTRSDDPIKNEHQTDERILSPRNIAAFLHIPTHQTGLT
jgi:hypothetical protein